METFMIQVRLLIMSLVAAQNERRRKRAKKNLGNVYSKFEKNTIIDATFHPLAEWHWSAILLDGLLHALNEQDSVESFAKFLKYNAPELLKRILKELG